MMPKVAPFFLLLLFVYFLCLNTAKVVYLVAYQNEWNAYSLSVAFSFTHYIYTRARALPGWGRLDHALPHYTTHHAHQGSSFWSILDASVFSFLSSRESGIYRGEGRRLRILDSQGLCLQEHFGRFFILPARIENPWIGGLGGAELVILREDFSGEWKLLIHHLNLSSAIR